MNVPCVRTRCVATVLVLCAAVPAFAQAPAKDPPPAPARADDFSPAFLGMYRKLMEIDDEIVQYSRKYDVDPSLARAVCMFESGGNANLTSGAGARGYFQVMPSTFRLMRVPTNIEAGIRYLSQLIQQFGREDYALAAYNGGPGRVARGRAMPLESLQYVLGVGTYRSVLKQYDGDVREQASALRLVASRTGDDFAVLSARLHVPAIELRMYNPFLSDARLRGNSYSIAYPADPIGDDLLEIADDGRRQYRSRIGDNYINLAFAFDVDVDRLRSANGLWRLQSLPANMLLTIPSRAGAAQPAVEATPAPAVVRVSSRPAKIGVHRVRSGETLAAIAQRYGTTIRAIQRSNSMGSRTKVLVGQRLRIPGD